MSTLDLFSVPPSETADLLPRQFRDWFASRGWSPREHQLALLAKAREERSALLIAPTGAGKTLAGFLPTLVELSGEASATTLHAQTRSPPPPLRERGMPLVPNDTAYPSPQPSPARGEGAWQACSPHVMAQAAQTMSRPPHDPSRTRGAMSTDFVLEVAVARL